MTYNDLKTEVAALGFESSVPDEDVLLFAANRALMTIFSERPKIEKFTGYKERFSPTYSIDALIHENEDVTVDVRGRSFSFRTRGSGSYVVEDESGMRTVSFASDETHHTGRINQNAKITFTGSFYYTVFDLAVYDIIFGTSDKDIPFINEPMIYDIAGGVSDFLAFSSLPRDKFGKIIENSELKDGKLILPPEFEGKFTLEYKRSPKLISKDAEETIDLSRESYHLLPLLTASYVWLDDDAEKSEYYASLYRDALIALKIGNRSYMNSSYEEITGWI